MWGEKYLVIAYIVFMTVGAFLCLYFFGYIIYVTLKEAAEAEEAEDAAAALAASAEAPAEAAAPPSGEAAPSSSNPT